MEEAQTDQSIVWLTNITAGHVLLTLFIVFIIILVVRTFRNKPSA